MQESFTDLTIGGESVVDLCPSKGENLVGRRGLLFTSKSAIGQRPLTDSLPCLNHSFLKDEPIPEIDSRGLNGFSKKANKRQEMKAKSNGHHY